MTVFLDSSGLVKLYVPERQHEIVRQVSGAVVVAAVTRVEVASAIWRKHRRGELDAADAAVLVAVMEDDLTAVDGRFVVVSLDGNVIRTAVDSVARHGLQAYDGVQLASALVARDAVGKLEEFIAFDADLRRAASFEGFIVIPDALDR